MERTEGSIAGWIDEWDGQMVCLNNLCNLRNLRMGFGNLGILPGKKLL